MTSEIKIYCSFFWIMQKVRSWSDSQFFDLSAGTKVSAVIGLLRSVKQLYTATGQSGASCKCTLRPLHQGVFKQSGHELKRMTTVVKGSYPSNSCVFPRVTWTNMLHLRWPSNFFLIFYWWAADDNSQGNKSLCSSVCFPTAQQYASQEWKNSVEETTRHIVSRATCSAVNKIHLSLVLPARGKLHKKWMGIQYLPHTIIRSFLECRPGLCKSQLDTQQLLP